MDVAVVGGGLAGLVAARRIAETGHDVTLFESRDQVGGRVQSTSEGPYTFDRGFQVLFTAYPAAREELRYDDLDLRRFKPGAIICRPGQRAIVSDPLRDPGAAVETALTSELTIGDKLRILALRRRLRRTSIPDIFDAPDEAIDEYLDRIGFSTRFRENFAAPFYGGITLDRSLRTSKRVFEFTFKMLAEGAIAVPKKGMQAIPTQLATRARSVGVTIETGAEVSRVTSHDDGVTLDRGSESLEFGAVVVATDPSTARSLTGCRSIPTAMKGCITQYFRLPGSDLDTGRRLLLNAVAAEGPNHVVPVTEVAPEHAPAEETIISATFLGTPSDEDESLAKRTREVLASWYPERSVEGLELIHTERISAAQFEQPPGVHDTLPEPRAPDGGVYLAGDYTRNCSINGALASGRDAALTVSADLE